MNIFKSELPSKARVVFNSPEERERFAQEMPFLSMEHQKLLSALVPGVFPAVAIKPFSLNQEDYPQEAIVSMRNLGRVAAALTELTDAPEPDRPYIAFGLGIARTIHEFMLAQLDEKTVHESSQPVA